MTAFATFAGSARGRLRRLYLTLGIIGLRRLPLFALRRLLGGVFVVAAYAPEITEPVYVRVPTSDVDTVIQIFVQRDYDFEMPSPRVIIDGGAYTGLSAVWFANRFPDASIYAVEMEASNYAMLERNVAPYPNVTPIRAALAGKNGDADTLTIDRLMTKYNLAYVDLLKLDIEGSEVEVFWNATPWIDRVGAITIELHDFLRPGCSAAFASATRDFTEVDQRGENLYVVRTRLPAGVSS